MCLPLGQNSVLFTYLPQSSGELGGPKGIFRGMLSLLVWMQSGEYDYHTGGQTKFESLINLESSGYKRAEYKVKKSDNGKASI